MNGTGNNQYISADPVPTGLAKTLKSLADQVERGDPALKGTRGFYLRKMFAAYRRGTAPKLTVVNAEHGAETT